MASEKYKSAKKMRLLRSVALAKEYRDTHQVHSGLVTVHSGKVTGICYELPMIQKGTFPGNPTLVEDSGLVWVVINSRWAKRVVNYTEHELDVMDLDIGEAEHISSVLRNEMLYVYHFARQQIIDWFTKCTAEDHFTGWKKLESLTIARAFDVMCEGTPLDKLIGKC